MNNLPKITNVRDILGAPTSPEYLDRESERVYLSSEPIETADTLTRRAVLPYVLSIKRGDVKARRGRYATVELRDPRDRSNRLTFRVPKKFASTLREGNEFALSPLRPGFANVELELSQIYDRTVPGRAKTEVKIPLRERLRSRFWFETLRDTVAFRRELPLFRLHCPKLDGCTASYESSQSSKEKVEYEVKFFGLAVGKGKEVVVEDITNYTIGSKCVEVQVEAELEATFGNLWLEDNLLMTGVRVDITKIDKDDVKVDNIPKDKDLCDKDPSEIEKLKTEKGFSSGSFDLTAVGPKSLSVEKVNKIEQETIRKYGVDLPLPLLGVPFSVSLGSQSSLSAGVNVKCEIAGGKKYFWYCSSEGSRTRSMECFWTING